jgi:predicted ATPase
VPGSAIPASLRAELQPLIEDAAAAPATQDGDRVRLYAAVLALLAELSARTAIAIMLDDLQWIDEASSSLLHALMRGFEASGRVIVAATARPGDLSDNKPAFRLVRRLAREGRLHEMALGPLGDAACTVLANAVAPGRDVAAVVAVAEGNPLFTMELARALAYGSDAVPDSIEAVLDEHLSRAEGAARTLLPWAAALGRAFDIGLLARCVTLSPAAWDSALEELERRGIIRCVDGDRYDFAHDLIRSVAYGRISYPRRRLIHGQVACSIAAALDANEGGAEAATELIRHAALGGDDALTARGCALAGDSCLRLFANEQAIDLALRGIHHLSRMKPGPDRAALSIALLRIQVLASSGSRLRSWPTLPHDLAEAVSTAETAGLSAQAATGYFLLSVLHQDEGATAEAQETTLQAAAAGRHAGWRTAAAQLANTARCLLELESGVEHARAVLAEASALSDGQHREVIELLWAEALHKRWEGRLDRAVPLMQLALLRARAQGDRWRECKCLAWLARINLELGEADASLACCRELRPLAERMGESGDLPFAHALEALSRLALGMPDAAGDLGSAVEELRAADSKAQLAYVLNAAALSALDSGHLAASLAAAEEALAAAEGTRRAWESATSRAILARLHAALGDQASAEHWLAPALTSAEQPDGLSARARAAVLHAAAGLSRRTPTLDQTPLPSV